MALPNPVEPGRGSGGAGRGGAAAGRDSGARRGGIGAAGAGRGWTGGGVGAETTAGLAGSITAIACQTLPHFEQRTLRPVGGMTAAVSKRVLQAGQIITVIVQNHHLPVSTLSRDRPTPLPKSIDTGQRVQHKDASWAEC
jgi:hypothetical protein